MNTKEVYVIYFSNKAKLLLVYKESFASDDTFLQSIPIDILKKIAYFKIRVNSNNLFLHYHSENSTTIHNMEDKANHFIFYEMNEKIAKNILDTLVNKKNLEFGKNKKTDSNEFFITKPLSSFDAIDLDNKLKCLKCIPLEIVKERYFIENKIYGFEPMIVKTKSKRHSSSKKIIDSEYDKRVGVKC